MQLTRHQTNTGPRWALDGAALPRSFTLKDVLGPPRTDALELLRQLTSAHALEAPLLAPIDAEQEVWASGVTYLRSRKAREQESEAADVYERVYAAARPELFFKATGSRVVGHLESIRVRRDARWTVPEPELTLILNSHAEVFGYCVGNDVSSRDIEGENPLYLPQAKVYNGSCALGPAILVAEAKALTDLQVTLSITRGATELYSGETRTSQIKRSLGELSGYLFRELSFPAGAFLMTGTGIVPQDQLTLQPGDRVIISVGDLVLENVVES